MLVGSELWYRSLEDRNAAIIEQSRQLSLPAVRENARRVFEWPLNAIQALCEEDLAAPTRFRDMPVGWAPWRAIASNTYETSIWDNEGGYRTASEVRDSWADGSRQ